MSAAVVYRLYDVTGDLLYIGSTVNLAQRLTNHLSAPYQCGDPENLRARFHSVVPEYYETVEDARYAEKIAIREEGPALNRQGNPKRWRMHHPSMKYVQVAS